MRSDRKRRGAVIGAVLFATIVATTGCQEPTKVAAKSPTPVHVADVASYPLQKICATRLTPFCRSRKRFSHLSPQDT